MGVREGHQLSGTEVGTRPHRVLHRGGARNVQPVSRMRSSPQAQGAKLAMQRLWI
nr:hypothetical protein [Methylacidiphilum caldifontis]